MKILHVSKYHRTGGAAMSAARLLEAQRAFSMDARMLVQEEKN